jgi:glutamine synthetase
MPDAGHDRLARTLDADGIDHVLLQFVDISGAAKGKLIPRSAFDAAARDGVGFAGAAVLGLGQGPQDPDMLAKPDPASYAPLPWRPGTARLACSLWTGGQPHPWCPRARLEHALNRLEQAGLTLQVGFEPEFFLVARRRGQVRPWDPAREDTLDRPAYDVRSMSSAMGYLGALLDATAAMGWEPYQADHEDGNAQFEVNFGYCDALAAADRVVLFRQLATELARPLGAVATFMPKPFADRTGSALHAHLHVADASGKNLFVDDADGHALGCSAFAYAFISGLIEHARALCAITSPTVNCYKRLGAPAGRSGQRWAPGSASVGGNNRTHMVRIAGPGNIEDRSPSAACNPYLALTVYAALALRAFQKPGAAALPDGGSAFDRPGLPPLPRTLAEAIDALAADAVVTDALGDIAPALIDSKREEWLASHRHVSDWELSRYLTAL